MRPKGSDELVEIALDDLVELVKREPDPVIGDPVLRVVVRPDLLRPLGGADHGPALGRERLVLLELLALEESALQHLERLGFVLELRTLILTLDDDPGGD